MKVAYVIGPYRADAEVDRVSNVVRAEAVAKKLWDAGFAVICPHMNGTTVYGKDMATMIKGGDANILAGHKEILGRCNFIVTVRNWSTSQGSISELRLARCLGVKVYHTIGRAIADEAN